MRIIAVTRVLNEEDVIEPLIRHHAPMVDHHIVLDNGSSDRTLEILASLKAEGARLTVLQCASVIFAETQFNTLLYDRAVGEHGADWVVFLDADEFIDSRLIGDLRSFLTAISDEHRTIGVELINYDSSSEATKNDINIVRRFVRRVKSPIGVWKVFVRGGLAPGRVVVDAGNHHIYLDGNYQIPLKQEQLLLAHYPNRSPLHWAGKAVSGWLKVLAAGQQERGRATHYISTFEQFKLQPQVWIDGALEQFRKLQYSSDLVDDPIDYRGEALLYTENVDYNWRALKLVLANMEKLATAYGTFLDNDTTARGRIEESLHDIHVFLGPDRIEALSSGYGSGISSVWRSVLDGSFMALLGAGWSVPEGWGGIWGVGAVHELRLVHLIVPAGGVEIDAEVEAALVGTRTAQVVDVYVKGTRLTTWEFSRERNRRQRSVHVPAAIIAENRPVINLEFRPRSVASPAELDPGNKDERQLGLCIRRVRQRPIGVTS